MTRKSLIAAAEQIEKRLRRFMPGFTANYSDADIGQLRDECDASTGSELDCQPLDILTEMVAARLKRTN